MEIRKPQLTRGIDMKYCGEDHNFDGHICSERYGACNECKFVHMKERNQQLESAIRKVVDEVSCPTNALDELYSVLEDSKE